MLTPLELPVSSHTSLADTTGYLLEYTGHVNQAKALESFVERAKSINPHISPIDAKIAPDFLRQRVLATESIVILLVEGACAR